MPILYIHGIAVREEGEHGWSAVRPFVQRVAWSDVEAKLREYVAPVLRPEKPEDVLLEQVYWGDLGVQPVPPPEPAAPPAPADLDPDALAERLEGQVRREIPVQAWPELIEAVWATAHDQDLRAHWQTLEPGEQWNALQQATETELHRRWHEAHPLRVWPWLQQFRQIFRSDLMHRVTELRSPLEGFLPYFMGDLLRYLSARGTPEQPGPIPQRVLAALERLQAAKQENGEPIVILTHSMGGQLMYDALSAFAPARPSLRDLQVDAWCASASQLGLFAGLGLFLTPTAPDGTLDKPANVTHLWNVWSPTDLLSYPASRTVRGAQDAALALTNDALRAHAEYLVSPDFYRALASKVAVTLVPEHRAAGK